MEAGTGLGGRRGELAFWTLGSHPSERPVCAKCVLSVMCVYMTRYAGGDVRTCLCPSMLVCVSVCVYATVCMCAYTPVCNGVCVHTHLCALECACLGVCVHVHVCAVRGQAYCDLAAQGGPRLLRLNRESEHGHARLSRPPFSDKQ